MQIEPSLAPIGYYVKADKIQKHDGWILVLLLITLLFAVIFMAGPIGGGMAVWLYIGISFITFGIYRLILSAKIRKINRSLWF